MEKDLDYGQRLLDWYAEMEKKEGKYYQGQKETYTANQDQENQDYIFYLEGWRYFFDAKTPKLLEKHIRRLRYQFVHREQEQWTPEQKKEKELLFAETILVRGSYIERFKDSIDYLFYCFEPVIWVEDKQFSGTESVAEKQKSEEYEGFRHLFYEDIETISIKNLEEWRTFYKQWLIDQNQWFIEKRRYNKAINRTVAVQYHKREIQAKTQPEWEAELKKVGYLFSHKPENGWTEQRSTKLFEVIDESGTVINYVFLGIREDIIDLPNNEGANVWLYSQDIEC
ncbi:hypothetical protein ABE893_03125 [Enterococcus entomosocium]|uniref:hypothetical protein n=1 Tax=Enterococcus entomosocium TaxID=3034352 RepID=UPI003D6A0167